MRAGQRRERMEGKYDSEEEEGDESKYDSDGGAAAAAGTACERRTVEDE